MEAFRGGVSEEKLSFLLYLSEFPRSTIRAVSSAILLHKCQALVSGYCWPSSCES